MEREELVKMREYQIGTASTEYYNKHPNADPISAFEDGVAWADEHPCNPWISVYEHPDDVTKDYLLEYEDGSHIVAMWDSGMWMSKNLHPLKDPTRWMPIPELKKGE